ncbi:MAG: endonuclease/exonuclease/phosphatase family protein, partial [Spirochaetales bacterium]|nr:endonuclease/exonuclease/phosphatase family protein [Spirochaetales bacterium]
LLQEVDSASRRSYNIDQRKELSTGFAGSAYALNHSCIFVPVPFPPMGMVNSGLYTMTKGLTMESAKRVSLPCPFHWPVSIFNLKQCLLVSYIPIEGSDRELVLVNLHLEAYTKGDYRERQTRQLLELMQEEYGKGNYVIAAGDFNQFMPGSRDIYPKTSSDWESGTIEQSMLPEGWTLAYDLSVPTARSNNQPYDPENPTIQHYSIDAMITSPNVDMKSIETMDKGFLYTDHNPLLLRFSLKAEPAAFPM